MTDVYLRHLEDAKGAKIGEVPFTDEAINAAFRLVGAWQVANDYDDGEVHSAQFVLRDGVAFFEILIGTEGD